MYFSVNNLTVSYPNSLPIVHNMAFSLAKGEIGCLLGFSGCGKTTALRAIAGLEAVDEGRISLDGVLLTETSHLVPPAKRGMGLVFQDYALFHHLTVAQNIGFGLHTLDKASQRQRIDEMLDLVGLIEHAHKCIDELSGGQQQRVALARALAPRPKLLLLDEPFSNLDVVLRQSLATHVRQIIKDTDTTAILVTHDQQEAFAMADKVGVMNEGRLLQFDTPIQLYHEPATAFVARFIGEGAVLTGNVIAGTIHTALGMVPMPAGKQLTTDTVKLLIRPDDVIHDDNSEMKAKVLSKVFRGADFLYQLQLDNGEKVLSLIPSHHNHDVGTRIGIVTDLAHVVIIYDY